jgi:hypothetical protein
METGKELPKSDKELYPHLTPSLVKMAQEEATKVAEAWNAPILKKVSMDDTAFFFPGCTTSGRYTADGHGG